MDNSRMLSETKRHHTVCRALLPPFFSPTWPSPDPPVAKTELLLRTRCVCWTFLSIFFRSLREMSMRKGKKVLNCHAPCSSPLRPLSFLVGIFGPVHSLARTWAPHCGGRTPSSPRMARSNMTPKGVTTEASHPCQDTQGHSVGPNMTVHSSSLTAQREQSRWLWFPSCTSMGQCPGPRCWLLTEWVVPLPTEELRPRAQRL